MDWVGRVIDGRYVVEGVVGSGGMGVVLAARHKFTSARVALKMVRKDLGLDPEISARFLAEARVPTAIDHRGVVKTLDAGKTPDDELYLVMELLAGRSHVSPRLAHVRGRLRAQPGDPPVPGQRQRRLQRVCRLHVRRLLQPPADRPAQLQRGDGLRELVPRQPGVRVHLHRGPRAKPRRGAARTPRLCGSVPRRHRVHREDVRRADPPLPRAVTISSACPDPAPPARQALQALQQAPAPHHSHPWASRRSSNRPWDRSRSSADRAP